MKRFFPFVLLILFTILFGVSQSADTCFYLGSHLGTKCFDPNSNKYICCSADHHCENGRCMPIRADSPSKALPLSTAVIIGMSVSVFCIVCLIVIAVYWHRRQITKKNKQMNLSISFSQSLTPSRTGSSAGFRVRSSTSQPDSPGTSVSIEQSKNMIP